MKKSSVAPLLFSKYYNLAPATLTKLGVFDPSLNVDTLLFPDPILAESSSHAEMRAAKIAFDEHFERVRRLLLHSNGDPTHVASKAAFRLLSFPEIPGTCLGYGSDSITGSGAGPEMTNRLMTTGYQIARLGVDDPDLFMAMGLFEENFGPDLIGDMFTNVAFGNIAEFNRRIYEQIGVATQDFSLKLKNGNSYNCKFARNPTISGRDIPIILMPNDILRDLPVALDWAGVQSVSKDNQDFRDSLNTSIRHLWSLKTLESKGKLKDWALSSASAFGDLLDMLHGMDGKPYDFAGDKLGEMIWRSFADRLENEFPFKIEKPATLDYAEVLKVVDKIIEQFTYLIENRDIWKELYTDDGTPRLEKSAQRLFYITALSYCQANNLDITPEAETGRGPVDFKFSQGILGRILVEIKLSKNGKLLQGYNKQLEIYNAAENSFASRYVIIDVGGLGTKLKQVEASRNTQISNKGSAPNLVLINGLPRPSASKTPI